MSKLNANLNKAKAGKNDEFYTSIKVIEAEMEHYELHFKNKVIYCNCDDPRESKFYQHFKQKFKDYGLKRLITTCYKSRNSDLFSDHSSEQSFARFFDGKRERETILQGDGDFRSDECIEFLEQADIVVTNPPFSLFREYLPQLIQNSKKFIILGNMNAFKYKEIIPFFLENKCWYGATAAGKRLWFGVPEHYEFTGAENDRKTDDNGNKFLRMKGVIRWFTNLDHKYRHDHLVLWSEYDEKDYPKYDNYDAIEVSRTKLIPKDFDGMMGVPISFMDKYNPEQFEILDIFNHPIVTKNEISKNLYTRVIIRRKQ